MTFTQASFLISAISTVVGALVSYKIYLLITGTLVKKGHRWLAQLAMISIAVGIGFISNEIMGSIFLGLTTRQEFILGKVVTNLIFLPMLLIGIIWISGGFGKKILDDEVGSLNTSNKEFKSDTVENAEDELDYSLSSTLFKEKYGLNDYDLAKAKNELQGKIPNVGVNLQLMSVCRDTTNSEKEAERKYIFTRAYQISKSLDREEPHKVSISASDGFKHLGEYARPSSTNSQFDVHLNPQSNFSWAPLIFALMIMTASIAVYNLVESNNKKNDATQDQKNNTTAVVKEEPNFFNSDMSYTLKNCQSSTTETQDYEFEKLKTSIDDRDAVLIGQNKKVYFEQCFLNGRYYQCKKVYGDEQVLKITFDVIEQNFWHEEIDLNDEKKIRKSIECLVR